MQLEAIPAVEDITPSNLKETPPRAPEGEIESAVEEKSPMEGKSPAEEKSPVEEKRPVKEKRRKSYNFRRHLQTFYLTPL